MDLNIHPPLPKRKDFRIGVLGSGFIVNECHLVAYRKAGFNPVAIASRNRANAEKVAARHHIPKVYESYDALLEDASIEVLDIAVPPQALKDLVLKACKRRTVKGILAQKPLGVSHQQAVEMVEACETAGITLAVNQNMRFDQSVRAAKTLLTNGTIGEPVLATIDMRGIPHWQPWQAELRWATLRIMSIHHLDTFRYWFGEPERIFCSTRPDPRTTFPHRDGICTYILEYANGLRCVAIDDPWTGPAKEGCPADIGIKWRIEGLNGLAMGDIGWCEEPYTTPSTIRYAAKGDKEFHAPTWTESWFPDAFVGTMADLLIALEDGKQPSISGRDNLKTMDLVEAAYESARQRQALAIQPQEATVKGSRWGPISFMRSLIAGAKEQSSHLHFTPNAQQALAFAREEARRQKLKFVGVEHLLLGLLNLSKGDAVKVLVKHGLDLKSLRKRLEEEGLGILPKESAPAGYLAYTPSMLRILDAANAEAKAGKYSQTGTEHLLLAMLAEKDGAVAVVFEVLSINAEEMHTEVQKALAPGENSILQSEEYQPAIAPVPIAEMSNFTPRAQQVLALARREVDRLNHNFVGTEHVLIGLIKLGQGVAVNVLGKLGVNLENVRAEVEAFVGKGPDQKMIGNIPYTPRVKRVIALAAKQAKALNHTYVGTEHILLGLLEEGHGVAARVLKKFDLDVAELRKEILKELDPNSQ